MLWRLNDVNVINLRNKLAFFADQKTFREDIMQQLTKLDGELADINDTKKKDFAVLSTKRPKRTRQKIRTDKKIVETILVRSVQSFCKFELLNPIEIKIEEDKILNKLQKYLVGLEIKPPEIHNL